MPDLLMIRGLDVSFGERNVLSGLDLTCSEGGVFALMGPGGIGKSTLLRVVCGESMPPSAAIDGEIRYRGRSLLDEPDAPRPSLVRQRLSLAMSSVQEYLVDNLPERHQLTRREQAEHLAEVLAERGLEELAGRLDDDLLDLDAHGRRALAIVRESLDAEELLCLDEPMAGLEDEGARQILELIERLTADFTLLLVTHHQARAREIADRVALLAEGRIVEAAGVEEFFAEPEHPMARTYVRTGGCSPPPEPEARADEEEADERESDVGASGERVGAAGSEEVDSSPAFTFLAKAKYSEDRVPQSSIFEVPPGAIAEGRGPRDFHWVIEGRLGGAPLPGLLRSIEHDLDALRRVQTDVLVTLTEDPLPAEVVERFGMESVFFPIPDMFPPDPGPAAAMCSRLQSKLMEGASVVFHCKAGIGRTGTMLAAMLRWNGMDFDEAVERVRASYRRYIQSEEQMNFLRAFRRGGAASS